MNALLEMRGIRKTFPGVVALDNVNLSVRAGEIHAIVGENGAGKSTLMKVLSGVYPHGSYSGEIRFDGAERRFAGIADSEHLGIIIIHQELALVPLLELKRHGIACILISHKLNEVAKVADAITVLRDGATVAAMDCSDGPPQQNVIIHHMVGRELADRYPRRTPKIGETVFELRDWRVHHPLHAEREVVKGVDLHVRRGEIVGIAGLIGAGRTELAMSVFGRSSGRRISGTALMHGREVDLGTVQKAVGQGLAYVTEDRKSLGLVINDSIAHNTTLANLPDVSQRGVIDTGREHAVASGFRRKLA